MLRVIGGRFRGRRLASPAGRGTRPSTGRMRNALMNILGPGRLEGASVLDLYAGTGASGIEALSRGARAAVFVETGRAALEALARNLETLGLRDPEARVLRGDAAAALAGPRLPGAPFDLVFVDPPYALFGSVPAAEALRAGLARLAASGDLAPGAVVVVEHPGAGGFRVPPAGLVPLDRRRYSAAGAPIYGAGDAGRGEDPAARGGERRGTGPGV